MNLIDEGHDIASIWMLKSSAVQHFDVGQSKTEATGYSCISVEVFYGTQYHPTVVRWYYRFFQFFYCG
jgi:hypothetical protein